MLRKTALPGNGESRASSACAALRPPSLSPAMRFALSLCICTILFALRASAAAPGGDEARFLGGTRQLTFEGKRSGEGYFHPDGNLLIFQSEREAGNPFYQIYLLDLLSGETARVSPGAGKTTCGFFQPGTLARALCLHASRSRSGGEAEGGAGVSRERASSAATRGITTRRWRSSRRTRTARSSQRLTDSPGYDAEGAFSPDGKQIVFCSLRGAYPQSALPEADARPFRERPGVVRRDLRHERGRLRARTADRCARLRWRSVLLAGRPADRLAAFRRERHDRGRLDDEDGRLGQAARHGLQVDVVGAVLSSRAANTSSSPRTSWGSRISSCSSSMRTASASRCA